MHRRRFAALGPVALPALEASAAPHFIPPCPFTVAS
jgi:hypothetical protein